MADGPLDSIPLEILYSVIALLMLLAIELGRFWQCRSSIEKEGTSAFW
jgi:hypothetical protein